MQFEKEDFKLIDIIKSKIKKIVQNLFEIQTESNWW